MKAGDKLICIKDCKAQRGLRAYPIYANGVGAWYTEDISVGQVATAQNVQEYHVRLEEYKTSSVCWYPIECFKVKR